MRRSASYLFAGDPPGIAYQNLTPKNTRSLHARQDFKAGAGALQHARNMSDAS